MGKYQNIINAVETRLKTIKTSNGYASNVGNSVYIWRTESISEKKLPAITIRDTGDELLSTLNGDFQTFRLSLDLDIATANKESTTAITEVRTLRKDLLKAIGTDLTFGGLAITTDYGSSDVLVDSAANTISGVLIKISITYRISAWEDN